MAAAYLVVLSIKVKESEDRTSFRLTEMTGEYSSTNTGGWGSPNNTIAQALTATITVYLRNSTTGVFELIGSVDAFDDLPSSTSSSTTGYFDVEASALDASLSTFVDGIYKIVYTVTGVGTENVPFSFSVTEYKVFDQSIRCCIAKKGVVVCGCCTDAQKLDFENISFMYEQLERSKCGNEFDVIQNHLDYLTKKCSDCGCS